MPLHHLHYAIQKLFGWQNSHLRRFILPEAVYQALTSGTVKGWVELVSDVFQPPSEAEDNLFWDDDYDGGSFTNWLKKRYQGPYEYEGIMEVPLVAKQDVKAMIDQFPIIEVRESFKEYSARKAKDKNAKVKTLRTAPLMELTLKEFHQSMHFESGTESLLERLIIDQVLAYSDETIDGKNLFPLTQELFYQYDFGDNWIVKMTKHSNYADLLEENLISEEEIAAAEQTVKNKWLPVCIYKQGLSVMDDVGGLSGYADFLATLYESKDRAEVAENRTWAKSMGWSDKKVSHSKML